VENARDRGGLAYLRFVLSTRGRPQDKVVVTATPECAHLMLP